MKGINKIEIHDIFQRIKNKEKDAVEVLYKKYYNLVRNISFSIVKDNDVAEEITQQEHCQLEVNMLDKVEVLYHSSIRLDNKKVIYIDPFKINENKNDADLIFITHDHYDHYSEEDIDKVIGYNTTIIAPKGMLTKILNKGIRQDSIISVEPQKEYMLQGIKFETIPAYNINKMFHPKKNGWVGYVIEIDGIRYYIAGDTDATEEIKQVKCDVAFIPVGGTYTMNSKEAANLINEIKPKKAIPIHYGSIVGTKQDATDFLNSLNLGIEGIILMK